MSLRTFWILFSSFRVSVFELLCYDIQAECGLTNDYNSYRCSFLNYVFVYQLGMFSS